MSIKFKKEQVISSEDAFILGFNFANRTRDCYDARDVGRVLTCDDFPLEFHVMSNEINWTRCKDDGMQQAIEMIRSWLKATDE